MSSGNFVDLQMPTPGMEEDAQRLQAWDLGAKVATLQAQGMREVHQMIRTESASREKAVIKVLDDLLFHKTEMQERFGQVEGELKALRAELLEEKKARVALEEALAEERTARISLAKAAEAAEAQARQDLQRTLTEELHREEKRRLVQADEAHKVQCELEERTRSLESFEKAQVVTNEEAEENARVFKQETQSRVSALESESRKMQDTLQLVDQRKTVAQNSTRIQNLESNQSNLEIQMQTNARTTANDFKEQGRMNEEFKHRLDTFQDSEVAFRQELLGSVKDIKAAGEHRDSYMGQQIAEAKLEAARHRESIRSIVEDIASRVATELEDHRIVLQRVDEIHPLREAMNQLKLEQSVAKEELLQRHSQMGSHMDSLEKHVQLVTQVQRELESDMMKEQAARQLCERRLESVGC